MWLQSASFLKLLKREKEGGMAGAAWDLKRSGCTSTDPGGTQGPLGSEVREGTGGELVSS